MRPLLALLSALTAATCHAGDGKAVRVEDEVRALIGLERGPAQPFAGRITSDLSCIDYGGGDLAVRGKPVKGWSAALALCQGRYVMLLEQFLGGKTNAEHRWRIVDAHLLPEVVGIEFDPSKPEGPYLYTPHECSFKNRSDSHFHAVVRLSNRKRMDWRTGVLGAWGYDMKQKRIVALDVKRVVCHKAEPE